MILVLCLNAAVDKTIALPRLRLARLNRPRRVVTLPGGKGINVARALRSLGRRGVVLGFTAGETGDFIEASLRREGIPARWLRLAGGQSRMCLAILDGRPAPTEINEPGAPVGTSDVWRLERAFDPLARRARVIVASGSLPPGCPDDVYARLIRRVRRLGRPVYLDASGSALKRALPARPDLVKMNRDEAASVGLPVSSPSRLSRALERLAERGPREAVVTLGAAGAVAFTAGRRLHAVPPRVRSVSPVGCGDTFLAALVRERLLGSPPERALAAAAGTATASTLVPGAAVFRPGDVARVVARVRVRPI
ncbi:MAG: 1-phosphofructokinase family hexose kinase [Elusimicrobia bacterium]|nr:1-phosphofructokinase family hexose kinase [Elusimicrobiota bacterium]